MLKNPYKSGRIVIEPNYGEQWSLNHLNNIDESDFIFINNVATENCLDLTLREAEFLVESLNEIIDYYNNVPKINDRVVVTNGTFKGCEGKIVSDGYYCSTSKPIAVKLDNNVNFINCICFVGLDDVRIIEE